MTSFSNYKKLSLLLLLIKKIINYRNHDQNFPTAHLASFFYSLYYNESDKIVKASESKIRSIIVLVWDSSI